MQTTSSTTTAHHFFSKKLPKRFAAPLLPATSKVSTSISSPLISPPAIKLVENDTDTIDAAYWDYQFLFVSQRSETVEPISLRVVEGALPSDFPSGTYYLTGPGIFSDDHGSTVHPLDGHGYLRAFHVHTESREVRYSARYIDTAAKVEESDRETGRWRFTHRGPFSVLKGGKKVGNMKVMKNVANTSVVKWGGRLLCFWEGGDPYEIDSRTLETVGKFDVVDGPNSLVSPPLEDQQPPHGGGRGVWDVAATLVKPILHGIFKMPPKRLLSHYKIDPKLDRLLLVSCNVEDMLLPRSTFTFYEFDSNFKLLQQHSFDIPEHLMIHDWAFTDSHYILFGNCIKLDIPGSMLAVSGLFPMISALSVDPSKPRSPMYMFPRVRADNRNTIMDRDWRVPITMPEQMWLLHVGNAFEQTDIQGNFQLRLHVAACSYQWFNFHKMFGYDWESGKLDPSFMNAKEGEKGTLPHLNQVTIKFNKEGMHEKCSVEALNNWRQPSDFPAINPVFANRRNTYIYAATSSGSRRNLPHFPFDTVVKFNILKRSVATWTVSNRRFIGEPIFVPKGKKEEDGYLLVVEYAVSIQRCYLIILDPKRIGEDDDAIVARLEVPKHLNFPLGFHGFWAARD